MKSERNIQTSHWSHSDQARHDVLLKSKEWYITTANAGKPQYPSANYRSIAAELYRKNSLVYAGITAISMAMAQAPFSIMEDDEKTEDSDIVRLLNRPSPFLTRSELVQWAVIHRMLGGNVFIEKVRSVGGSIVELWLHSPDLVKIVPDRDRYVGAYIVTIDGRDFAVEPEDMIHWKNPDPLNHWFGMPDILPALTRAIMDNELTDKATHLAQNNFIPPLVIKTQMARADEPLLDRLRAYWKKTFGGKENHGLPAFLGKDMDVQVIGLDASKAAIPELSLANESRVLMVLGVPPILVGAQSGLNASTYSNYREARLAFYQDRIVPLQDQLANKLTLGLVEDGVDVTSPEWRSEKAMVIFDTTKVPAMQEIEINRRERIVIEFEKKLLTREEARLQMGLPIVPEVGEFTEAPSFAPPGNSNGPPTEGMPSDEVHLNALSLKVGSELLGRLAIADYHFDAVKKWARDEFKLQGDEVLAEAGRRLIDTSESAYESLDWAVGMLAEKWQERMAETAPGVLSPMLTSAWNNAAESIEKAARPTARIAFPTPLTGGNARTDAVFRFITDYSTTLSTTLSKTGAEKVRRVLRKARRERLRVSAVRDELSKMFKSWSKVRAEAVARTETVRASNGAARAAYKQGGVEALVWKALGDACPYCQDLNGNVVGVDDSFIKAGETFQPEGATRPLVTNGAVEFPPAHVNCLPGDALILSVGGIAAVTSRPYQGDMIVIRTASGVELPVTPNHPVLTPTGWRAARALEVGDDVVRSAGTDWQSPGVGNHSDHVPALFSELSDALGESDALDARQVPTTAKDFHGDARDGNVAVVRAYRSLRHAFDTPGSEKIEKRGFVPGGRRPGFSRLRSAGELVVRHLSTAASLMSGGDLVPARLVGHPGPFQGFGSGAIAEGNSRFAQQAIDRGAADAKLARELVDGCAGQVAFDQIVALDVAEFQGHVYNLQTGSGAFIGNSIVTHNCRCVIAPAALVSA